MEETKRCYSLVLSRTPQETNIVYSHFIIIISILMSPLLGTSLPYGLHLRKTGHNLPRGPSAGWWVLTTANAAGTNGLTCLPKHGGARYKFLVTHPMIDQRCLTSAIARQSVLTAGPSSSSIGVYETYMKLNSVYCVFQVVTTIT
jgi:hypothetical protein